MCRNAIRAVHTIAARSSMPSKVSACNAYANERSSYVKKGFICINASVAYPANVRLLRIVWLERLKVPADDIAFEGITLSR